MKKPAKRKPQTQPLLSEREVMERQQRAALMRARLMSVRLRKLARQVGGAKRQADAALLFLQHQLNTAFPIEGRLPGFEVTNKP